MIRALQKAGMDVVVLGPDQTKYGAVETLRRGEELRGAVQITSGGNRRRGRCLAEFWRRACDADTLRLSRLGVPVLVQATPDTPGNMAITHRRDSFCGKMSACNNLRQYGIPYSLTTLHTETPDSRVRKGFGMVRRRMPRRAWTAEFANWSDCARPTAFNTVRYSEKLLERAVFP